ncbi:MAG TPA: hypothetical protein PLH23_07960 [Hyphomonadaceae bacterium]|nr:hypothetical protein [Hyphomonadaceae bacterium]HPI48187.1 hypothetical protein [Hyphomonadaceae bacterium]
MIRSASTSAALAALAIASGTLIAAPSAVAQEAAASTRPDFTGMWTNESLTGLTRTKGLPLVVSSEEAIAIAKKTPVAGLADFVDHPVVPADTGAPEKGGEDFGTRGYNAFWVTPGENLALVKGEYRTSYIVEPGDGQLPFVNEAEATKAMKASEERYVTGAYPYAGPEETELSERCLIGFGGTGGPGMLSVLYNNTYQFVQTENHLLILVEMAHDARIIPIFASAEIAQHSHRSDVIKPWLGDSVAWWEGATLVVESINIRPEQGVSNAFPLTPGGKVTERLTRASADEIFYEFSVEDPAIYKQPWKAELSFNATPKRLFEYACHEGNYGLPGMLAGVRLAERKAKGLK